MPVIESAYRSPSYLRNPHLATILPSMYRKVELNAYDRERIFTTDGDFLDLDWIHNNSENLVILSHGLEGSSDRGYMQGMAKYFSNKKWDVIAWNCRSCSGEMNKLPRLYNHADIEDIASVIAHVKDSYKSIFLIGFSMGGNISLNYLGKSAVPENVKGGVVFSVPLLLKSSVIALMNFGNGIYRKRFLKKLSKKIEMKASLFPEVIDHSGFSKINNFQDFDNRYTAPLHGFKNAEDFYQQGSPLLVLDKITKPVLIVNAKNDPMLGADCYPYKLCQELENVFLETPSGGGHVGFAENGIQNSFMDRRAFEFINSLEHQ